MFSKSLSLISCLFILAGCATGVDIGEECESNEDCNDALVCNTISKTCETLRIVGDTDRDMGTTKPDTSTKDDTSLTPDQGQDQSSSKDMGSDQGQQDMGKVCEPTCAGNEKCEDGTCVEACNPGCVAPQICTENGCEFPTCTQKGDKCETTTLDQGSFFCRDLGNGGECLPKCTETGADSCASGEYCIPIGNDSFNCEPSECPQQSDCTNESCLRFDNDYGRCFPAGTLTENAVCDLSASTCAPGLTCNTKVGAADGMGTCQKICSPWSTPTGCDGGDRCSNFVTSRSFSCSPDSDATGTEAFTTCTTPRASCDDATQCFALSTVNGCFKYCRPGTNDCDGLQVEAVCNNHLLPGEDTWGICEGSCLNQADCGDGLVCVAATCRRPCTDNTTVVNDCCGGDPVDCEWTCNAGLCE